MKNITHNKGGFSSIVAILIALGVIVIGGGIYFFTHPSVPTQQPFNNSTNSEQSQNTVIPEENQQLNGNLVLELEVSSLSKTKGAADIYWDRPGGFAAGKHERVIATPLDLVDGMKITNNTNKAISLVEINNESRELLSVVPEGRATPIILLPEKFIKNSKEEIACRNRNLFSDSINNICTFAKPIVIAPKETIFLRPQLFAVPNGLWEHPPYTREKITFLDGKENKNFVYVTAKSGKRYLFLSNTFQEYDQVSQSQTFNIGGVILVNAKDKNFVNKVFIFKTSDGQKIDADIRSTTGLTIKSFGLPQKGFEAEKNKFSDDILTLQVFLYRNSFLGRADISGEYDDRTVVAIKQLQKSAGIVETGKPDDATIFVSRGFDTGIALYENYGDEEVTVSFDSPQPYFRLFSIGTRNVNLNKDFSDSSLITKVVKKVNCGETYCGVYAYTLDGREIFTLGGITILNNTHETKSCTLTNPSGVQVKSFQIAPNGMYSQRTTFDGISASAIYRLQCGNKSLDIELFPEEKGRG